MAMMTFPGIQILVGLVVGGLLFVLYFVHR